MQIPSIAGSPVLLSTTLQTNSQNVSAKGASAVSTPAAAQDISAQTGSQTRQPSDPELAKAIEEVQKALEPVAQNLHFSVDKDSGRTLVKIVDSSTDKVIRQIPSEEVLAISKAIDRLQGMLLKDKA